MFRFSVLDSKDKKKYIRQKLFVLVLMVIAVVVAINITNPTIVESSEKISVSIGAMIGIAIFLMALMNRLKTILKIKFATFIILWIFLLSLRSVIDTAVWSFGLLSIPLAIDDIIFIPYWKKVWYNNYER